MEGKTLGRDAYFPVHRKIPENPSDQDKRNKPSSRKMGARGHPGVQAAWGLRSNPRRWPHLPGTVARLLTPLCVESLGAETRHIKKVLWQTYFYWGNSLSGGGGGGLVTIIVIMQGIIGIIISIISTTSTNSTITSTPSGCSILSCNPYLLLWLTLWVLITLCNWCYWVLSVTICYERFVHHIFITSDHDPYFVSWVVRLVL